MMRPLARARSGSTASAHDRSRPAARRPGRARAPILLGFALLVLVLGIDFHLDVRARDAFSWMDPYQYYDFARGSPGGPRAPRPTSRWRPIFPLLRGPLPGVSASIPSALWAEFAALLLLLLERARPLRRAVGLRTPSPGVAALVASSPCSSDSHEPSTSSSPSPPWCPRLRAVAAPAARTPDWRSACPSPAVVAGGLLTKTTFPLFLFAPVAAAVWERVAIRRDREALVLAAASLVPIALVLLV